MSVELKRRLAPNEHSLAKVTGFQLFAAAIAVVSCLQGRPASACDLCAIYSSNNPMGEPASGFQFLVSEQYIPFGTRQFNGVEAPTAPGVTPEYLDRSITHLVPGYNFCSWFGLNLNVPISYRSFRRRDIVYSLTAPPVLEVQEGVETALGDIALIGRFTVLRKAEADYGVVINLLGGVKFPTGGTEPIKNEVEQQRIFELFLPPGTPHDPLGHSISGIHEDMLSPGSGSYDGIFGVTINSRWLRGFFNSQFQYYLRTPGQSGFQYGDEILISGGPGAYLILNESWTMNLQFNATYQSLARDQFSGEPSNSTGWTGWFVGPQTALTIGEHFSANAGIDIPLHIANNGLQNVPSYVVHAGFGWRF